MIETLGRMNAKFAAWTVSTRCAVLLMAVAATAAVAMPIGYSQDGMLGLAAVGLAAVVCGACSLVALILATRWHGTPNGVSGALAGSLVGMFPPLAIGLALQHNGSPLAEAGAFGWIVVFYLTTLAVKTLLVAPAMSRPTSGSPVGSASPDVVSTVSVNSATKAGA